MLNRKAYFYAVMLILLTACTKQDITPVNESVQAGSADDAWWWPRQNQDPDPNPNPYPDPTGETIFGLLEDDQSSEQTEKRMDDAGITLIRMPIFLSERTINKGIDDFIEDGYDVQINLSWFQGQNGYRGFPESKDLNLLKSRAEEFFQHYAPYKDQIPFVAVENEWDWDVVHGGNLQDYLAELAIVTDIGHKYGFKITDGAITGTALQRWTYSQLSAEEQEQWIDDYYVGLKKSAIEYDYLMDIVNTFIAGVQDIDLDYINVHWYNTMTCNYGFPKAAQIFMEACNKEKIVCNEFGIRTSSLDLYSATVDEVRGAVDYAITYSGNDGSAVWLTDAMLDELVP